MQKRALVFCFWSTLTQQGAAVQRCFRICKISISYSYTRHWFGVNILPQNFLVKCPGMYKIRQCYTSKPLRAFLETKPLRAFLETMEKNDYLEKTLLQRYFTFYFIRRSEFQREEKSGLQHFFFSQKMQSFVYCSLERILIDETLSNYNCAQLPSVRMLFMRTQMMTIKCKNVRTALRWPAAQHVFLRTFEIHNKNLRMGSDAVKYAFLCPTATIIPVKLNPTPQRRVAPHHPSISITSSFTELKNKKEGTFVFDVYLKRSYLVCFRSK